MREMDNKKGWASKNWCFRTMKTSWDWKRLLRIPWTARRSNQSMLKEITPEYSLKGLMLKLKYQYFGHLIWKGNSLGKKKRKQTSCWERLKAGGEGDNRRWNGWMTSPTQWTWVRANSGRWWRTWKSGVLQFMGLKRVGHDWVTEQEQQTRACKSGEVLAWPFPDQFRNFTGLELIKFSDPDLCYWSSQTTNIQKQNTNVLFYSK